MLEQLKELVFRANLMLPKHGLITFTWGNVSGIDRDLGFVVIKPSGVSYDDLTPEQMMTYLDRVRVALAAAEEAKKKNLGLGAGFCWRYNLAERALFERVHAVYLACL